MWATACHGEVHNLHICLEELSQDLDFIMEKSPGLGEELGDDLVLAAFVGHLLQPEMSLPDLSVLLC